MASTTSTRDSGLMDVLLPVFSKKTGYEVKPIYVGSGQAMTMGERGEADVLLVHAPASEIKFMQNGYGIDRRLVMHNDFILVGPPSDPAGIKGISSVTEALQKISNAKVNFYSRGDNSGTDQLEKSLWAKIGIIVKDGSSSNPGWYLEANLGMGDLLRVVSEKQGYTITDRATYLNNLKTLSLEIMVQGDKSLLNVYHVIIINPAKSSRINYEGAKAFADFMVSSEVQSIIAKFGVDKYGQNLFFPDAGKTDAELGLPVD
ncbi:MAG: substrate-binding domain-containing protein [Dehalococcoidales bacterium]|nr:substrate-binding domain-containing protein [Dehalococcoidales bacterium]